MSEQDEFIGEFIREKCPRCGCNLLANKAGDKWCSFIGGTGIAPCTYGLEDQPKEETLEEAYERLSDKRNE